MLFIGFFSVALSVLGPAIFAGLVLKVLLHGVFKVLHWKNYSTASPSGLFSWLKLAPPDILFRLTTLAALNLILYWLPIYYWSTYTPSGDDRDGGLVIPSMIFCPVSWILGVLCVVQVWRSVKTSSPAFRIAFRITCFVLLLVIFSTVLPQMRFYLRSFRE